MEQVVYLTFTPSEIKDVLEAIETARGELCLGPGMVEAHSINERWGKIAEYLEAKLDDER